MTGTGGHPLARRRSRRPAAQTRRTVGTGHRRPNWPHAPKAEGVGRVRATDVRSEPRGADPAGRPPYLVGEEEGWGRG